MRYDLSGGNGYKIYIFSYLKTKIICSKLFSSKKTSIRLRFYSFSKALRGT